MPEPLSPRNAEVARLRDLARDRGARHEAGRFLVEGTKLLGEALAAGLDVDRVYATTEWSHSELEAKLDLLGIDIARVSDRGLERIASTASPQPVVAEVAMPSGSLPPSASAVLIAVDVNDPGNVGTLARSAVAAGFDAVMCLGNTADPYGPKTVRSSAGALFHVPVIIDRDPATGLDAVAGTGLVRLGTRMTDAVACDQADLTQPIAIVLGSEAHGLSDAHAEAIDGWLAIPMEGETESLNVAMAGTILAYETARQRRR